MRATAITGFWLAAGLTAGLAAAQGVAPGPRTTEGPPPDDLWIAAARGDLESVKELLEEGEPVDVVDRMGRTPLLLAARWGHEPVVRELLAAGAFVEHHDATGNTALLAAVAQAPPARLDAVVTTLLDAGARPGVGNDHGETALMLAVRRGHAAAAPLIARLLAAGVDPDPREASGRTALHIAAERGRLDLVAALLAGGADPALPIQAEPDAEPGPSALDLARRAGNDELTNLLIRASAAAEEPDESS